MKTLYTHPLPRLDGVSRIVLFSNVTDGFSVADVGLRSGDLCIHLNTAVHAAEAMKVAGTRHMLVVRHGHAGRGRWRWFAPESFEGYEHILFTPVHNSFAGLDWWREYMNATGGKMPSTGFLAFMLARTEYPSTPVLLAGFDPGIDHGTPLFHGHAWGYEASYYSKAKVPVIEPKCMA